MEGKGQKPKKVVVFLKEKMEFMTRKDKYKKILIWLNNINSPFNVNVIRTIFEILCKDLLFWLCSGLNTDPLPSINI